MRMPRLATSSVRLIVAPLPQAASKTTSSQLCGVAAALVTDAWAVGTIIKPLILRWTGTAWE